MDVKTDEVEVVDDVLPAVDGDGAILLDGVLESTQKVMKKTK